MRIVKGNHLHLSHRSKIGKSEWALALSVTERKRKDQIQVQMDFVTEIEEKWIVDQLCQKLIHQKNPIWTWVQEWLYLKVILPLEFLN